MSPKLIEGWLMETLNLLKQHECYHKREAMSHMGLFLDFFFFIVFRYCNFHMLNITTTL